MPPLRDVIRRYHIDAQKSLGQNFLLDLNLTARIARAAAPLDETNVIEIGAGPGGLTRALLLAGARNVTAIERDPRCLAALEELSLAFPGRLSIFAGDALKIDCATLAPTPRKIVANLPYNIATVLLLGWIRDIGSYESLTLMFQKEVAQRLVAAPRSKEYGRLSVMTQWVSEVRLLFDIAPRAFVPPPKVTSTVVQIVPRPTALAPANMADVERVTGAAFGQRRKMLRSSLKSLGVDTGALFQMTGVMATARAEELSVEEFCALARAVALLRTAA